MYFQVGDRVRIKDDAFPGSTDKRDVESRGTIGNIIEETFERGLFVWRGDNGHETYPIHDELELIERAKESE